jgi:hypothetical protein
MGQKLETTRFVCLLHCRFRSSFLLHCSAVFYITVFVLSVYCIFCLYCRCLLALQLFFVALFRFLMLKLKLKILRAVDWGAFFGVRVG